jgi:hypothetical protein
VEEVEENPWGDGYKIATGKIRRDIPPSTTETWHAVRKLFPQGGPLVWTSPREEDPAFTAEELQAAAKRLRPKKAPGPDGIPPEVVKNLVEEVPEVFLEVMNDCLRIRTFPRTWKVARLILLPKGKPGTEKRKFRPICLLNTLGKLLEHLIRARLANNLEEKGGLSDAQFGFREGLSTVDAFEEVMKVARFANVGTWDRKDYCALALIDVENAFNSAPWARVVEAMERWTLDAYLIGLIQSYLTERGLVVTNRERVEVVCGVPQGSVLGPVLWNITFAAPVHQQRSFRNFRCMPHVIRNVLGEGLYFVNGNGKNICFRDLVSLQEEKDLHLANKIRRRHVNFQGEKMKVKLAVQTFSSEVAKL